MEQYVIEGQTKLRGMLPVHGAKNAALFAVQILATKYPELVEKLAEDREKMKAEVKAKGEKLAALRASEQ